MIYLYNLEFPDGTLTPAVDSRTVTLIEDILPLFKQHSRIAVAGDDDLCKMYLNSAMSRVEQFCEMPIIPLAYSWTGPKNLPNTATGVVLPFRNTVGPGDQFGFELLIAAKQVPVPVTWPMIIEVGFASGAEMPDDIKLGVFELALSLYELRSNSEMLGVYAESVMRGNLSRYWVPRC